jgi:hypothetical protein
MPKRTSAALSSTHGCVTQPDGVAADATMTTLSSQGDED